MIKKNDYQEVCPVLAVQKLVAGKWKLAILWQLSQGTKRFNELQRLLTEISQGILTQQLRELESDGLVKYIKRFPQKWNTLLLKLVKASCPYCTGYVTGVKPI